MRLAESSASMIENLTDPTKPLVSYRVRISGYAQRTGGRLFVQLAYFQFNRAVLFRDSVRRDDVYLDFSYSEHDEVRYAVRILTREGRRAAARKVYLTDLRA